MDKLAVELLDIVQSVKGGIIKGTEFAQGQAPELIEQLLRYELISATVLAIMFLIIFLSFSIIPTVLIERGIKKTKEAGRYCDGGARGFYILTAMISFFTFIAMICYIMDILKIWIAPKIYLIEYLSGLIK